MASDPAGVDFTHGRCPRCAEPYRVTADMVGATLRCRACDHAFAVGADGPAPFVGDVIEHKPRSRGFELAVGEEELIEAIDRHIAAHIGSVESVFHEIISDLVHVDVHWVKPDVHRPWHTLITSGMSEKPMSAPEDAEDCAFAELLVRLPPNWKLSKEAFEDERWYWPLRCLKLLARLPHEYETWLWEGHTVPAGDPPEPLAPNTEFCCLMLAPPSDLPEEFHVLDTGEKRIHFFSMIPLYREEMEHKLKFGYEAVTARFEKHGITDVIKIGRPNVCRRKRFFGLF